MPLRCPTCGAGALRIDAAIELGSDARSDEVALQVVSCSTCGLEAVAVYEESRRGALDDESVNHAAFPSDAEALAEVRRVIRSCRRARNADCACAGHKRARAIVRTQTEPAGIDWAAPMPIAFVRR